MFALAFLLFVIFCRLEAVEIICETSGPFQRSQNCCFLNGTTIISDGSVEFGGLKNLDVNVILFDNNKKIKFLPVKAYEVFPNLEIYSANSAAVKKISPLNFARLFNCKLLDLSWNKIEIVPDGCFLGLSQLQKINLKGNNIQKVNAKTFLNLPHLSIVDLEHNDCIHELFEFKRDSSEILQKLSRRCGSTDFTKNQIFCSGFPLYCNSDRPRPIFSDKTIFQCCEMESGSYIDARDFSFAMNVKYATYLKLVIAHQRTVEFLPILIHERFPILKLYLILNTPIRRISRENFEKMFMLEKLTLDRNQIETIKSDTFKDLINLNEISITNQPLIALNGQAFMVLPKISFVFLNNNHCIDRLFTNNSMPKTSVEISEKCGFEEFDSVDISCESYDLNRCLMKKKTEINATNFVISEFRDEGIKGVTFDTNKKIEYLPYKIFMQFPNLVDYQARDCAIKAISKQNFEKLVRLEVIWLSNNQIQKIYGNTFKGLERLKQVDLFRNQIKSINGRTFDQLPMLSKVDMRGNECTNDSYVFKNESIQCLVGDLLQECTNIEPNVHHDIKNFTHKIIQQCAFTETGQGEFEKVFDVDCGVGKGGTGFVIGGSETEPRQWPFMAALFLKAQNKFLCGGNIITASHILTAAHCIQNKHDVKPKNASEIDLHFGRHNISCQNEVGPERREVNNIKIHPNWNSSDKKYGGDIAVLEMDRPVQFSELIQPVCLTLEPELSQQEAGFVVGWGKSGNSSARHENIPRQVLISSETTDVCFAKDHRLGSMFSEGMFCAGGDGFGPCQGDSGGGFYVRYEGLWTLRGIVSSGTNRDDGFSCDVDRYTLFTNAVDYSGWIKDSCKVNGSSVSSSLQEEVGGLG